PVEATIKNPNASVSQLSNHSRDVMRLPPEPDVVSSDSTNSVREQLRQVNQRLDEVQRDFVRSKEEAGETTKGGSPFAPEILDKPIPSSFRLPTLEPYDGSTDPTEHVAAFRAQMALYDTSDALMCRIFPTTLRGPTQIVRAQLHSKFLPEADDRLTAQPHTRKRRATRPIHQQVLGRNLEDARHSSYFGNPSIPYGTSALMILLVVDQEALVHSARDVTTGEPVCSRRVISGREAGRSQKPQGDKPQGQPSEKPRRKDGPELPAPRPFPIPLNLTQTEVFLQIRDKGLLKTPNPIRAKIGGRNQRRYCRFHQDYDHDTEECNDLRNQIEYLIRQGHLHRFIRDQRASEERPRFMGDSVSPTGTVVLPVVVGEEPRSKTLLVSFIVVVLPSAYNTIIDRPTLNKLRAVVSTYHRIMKFPTRAGVGEVRSDPRESRQCYLTATTLPKKLKDSPPTYGVRDSSNVSPKPKPTKKVLPESLFGLSQIQQLGPHLVYLGPRTSELALGVAQPFTEIGKLPFQVSRSRPSLLQIRLHRRPATVCFVELDSEMLG
ncbi:hypothetical protein BHE74_00056352, partial [Ensete ventricosum]